MFTDINIRLFILSESLGCRI